MNIIIFETLTTDSSLSFSLCLFALSLSLLYFTLSLITSLIQAHVSLICSIIPISLSLSPPPFLFIPLVIFLSLSTSFSLPTFFSLYLPFLFPLLFLPSIPGLSSFFVSLYSPPLPSPSSFICSHSLVTMSGEDNAKPQGDCYPARSASNPRFPGNPTNPTLYALPEILEMNPCRFILLIFYLSFIFLFPVFYSNFFFFKFRF